MHGDESCTRFPGAGACQPSDGIAGSPGQCLACSASNASACGGATPACNTILGACQLCTVAEGGAPGDPGACATAADGHVCLGTGAAVLCGCNTDVDCGALDCGRICDGGTHLCADGCSREAGRNGCPSGMFCSADVGTGACGVACVLDDDCASTLATPFCDGPMGVGDAGPGARRCVACRSDADCASSAACTDGACVARPDAGTDAATTDAGSRDAGATADAARSDSGARADASTHDASGALDAGGPAPTATGGCGCSVPTTHGRDARLVVVLALLCASIRRRARR